MRFKNLSSIAGLPIVFAGCITLGNPANCQNVDWKSVGNDPGANRFSSLKQIDKENVKHLKLAWSYHTGDADLKGKGTTIECTPIIVNGIMYVTSARSKVVALDAATGFEKWVFNPYANGNKYPIVANGVNRGVAYWTDGFKKRIFLGTADGRLISINADSGLVDSSFGENGEVDLRKGMDRDVSKLGYGVTSAPVTYKNLVFVGMSEGEGPEPAAPGDISAFDAKTGERKWTFHTVPRPGEYGNNEWENESWVDRGGANPWSGFTVDQKNGILFGGLGSATFDFYGGDRKGTNLFANCSLALDAMTGKRIWHFQVVHHDVWDHDIPYPPICVNLTIKGKKVDAVAQITKTGYVYVFDRKTGKPIYDVVEKPYPASDIPGEKLALTQPRPVAPPAISKTIVTEDDITTRTPEAHAEALERFRKYRNGVEGTPPSFKGSITMPGFHGGATWSGASFDPETGILYVNTNNMPNVTTIIKAPEGKSYPYSFTGYNRFLDKDGYPAIKPPWGLLNAVNLNTGKMEWQIPLGEYPELAAQGLKNTGCENFGGTIVTLGGLVFIGGSRDEKFHAFDKSTGKQLWEYKLPAGGYATPSTYMVNGRQYVVIAAGGGGKIGTKSGDEYLVFTLP